MNTPFGPVFRYDLVRSARQGRLFLLRCVYAFALLVVLFLVYTSWFQSSLRSPWDLFSSIAIPIGSMAAFAESCFWTFMAVQLGAVFLLTPVIAGGAIAEERQRRTLPFLLTTDLHDH